MNPSTFHLNFTESAVAREQGLALRQQGLACWQARDNDAAGSVLYAQGSLLIVLANVLNQREQNSRAFVNLPALEDSSAQVVDLHSAVHALSASCDGLVQTALKMLDAMKGSVLYAEKLAQSDDRVERAGVNLHLGMIDGADELIGYVLKPLPALRSEAAQVLRRYVHAKKSH